MRYFATSLLLLVPFAAFSAEIPDAKFYRDAAEGGLAEVAMETPPQQKAESRGLAESSTQIGQRPFGGERKTAGSRAVKEHHAARHPERRPDRDEVQASGAFRSVIRQVLHQRNDQRP